MGALSLVWGGGNDFWPCVAGQASWQENPSIAVIIGLLMLLVVGLMLWNRALRASVQLQTAAVRESEQRLADIIDFLPDAALAIDLEGKVIIWNRAIEAMTGLSSREIIGRGDFEYAIPFYGERRPILIDLVFRSYEEIEEKYSFITRIGDLLFTETTVPRVKGVPRVLAGKASPLYDLNGNIIGAIETIRDVTENHEAADALKASLQQMEELNTIITNSPAIAFLWKRATGWPVEYVSENVDILGYSAEGFMSGRMNFASIVHPDDIERIGQEVLDYTAAGIERFKQEYRIIDSQGRIVWVDDRTWIRRGADGSLINYQGVLLDITARKEAEQSLELINRQLQDIIAFLPDATLVVDRESRIIAWNQAMERLTGVSSRDLIGQSSQAVSRLFYEDVRPLMIDVAMKGPEAIAGYYQDYEFRDNTLIAEHFVPRVYGGKGAYVQGIAAPLYDAAGQVNGAIECLRDISRQKEADDVRRQDERRMRTMLDLYVMAREGSERVLDFALESALIMTGSTIGYIAFFKEEEELFEIVSWSRQAMVECRASSPPEGYRLANIGLWGEPIRQRKAVVTNDYENADPATKRGVPEGHIPIKRHMSLPVFEGERVVAIAGVGNKDSDYNQSDVSQLTLLMNGMWGILQRKQAEEQSQRLQEMLRDIFDYMPSMLCSIDPEFNVTQWNRQAEEELGVSREEALGQSIRTVLQRRPRTLGLVDRTMGSGLAAQEEISFTTPEGVPRTLDVTVYPLEMESGRGAVIRSDDISDKRRMQEIMIQTEKILSVGGMAAGMAHEINNPLGGILQGVQNIYRRLDPDLARNRQLAEECQVDLERVRCYMDKRHVSEFLDGIRESGTRAARIVGNMLQFSRQAEGRMGWVQLGQILDNALELASGDYDLRKRYDFKHFEIIREYDPRQEPVQGIETELEQVALNIMKNAAQAYTEEARRERRPRITLRTYDEEKMAVFEIEDNGPGMPDSIRRQIFDPFYTTKPPGEGTGLGLSVSYFIIANNHKGQMYVESAPGQGSRFVIKIPRTQLEK